MYNRPGLPHAGAAGGSAALVAIDATLSVLVLIFALMALATIVASIRHERSAR